MRIHLQFTVCGLLFYDQTENITKITTVNQLADQYWIGGPRIFYWISLTIHFSTSLLEKQIVVQRFKMYKYVFQFCKWKVKVDWFKLGAMKLWCCVRVTEFLKLYLPKSVTVSITLSRYQPNCYQFSRGSTTHWRYRSQFISRNKWLVCHFSRLNNEGPIDLPDYFVRQLFSYLLTDLVNDRVNALLVALNYISLML